MKSILFLILGLLLFLSGIAYLLINKYPLQVNYSLSQIFTLIRTGSTSAQFTTISTFAPTEIRIVKGSLVRIATNYLTVQIPEVGTQNFIVSKTFDFQKLVSGSPELGNAKTVPASYSDLEVGQTLLLIAEKDSNYTRSVYILK